MSLNREEIIKSKSYKVTRAALDWYKGNPDADVIDGFESGWNAAAKEIVNQLRQTLSLMSNVHPSIQKHIIDVVESNIMEE